MKNNDNLKIRSKFYSVYFTDGEIDRRKEIEVMEHENSLYQTDSDLDKRPNYFKTKAEAMQSVKKIWDALNKKG
jgi:hypothetical protein